MDYRGGQVLGRHELVAPLGAGAMGEVWEAVLHGPQGFDKRVALKLLRGSPTEYLRETLIREARVGALLHHPNVVGTYELGSVDGVWFVAMELVRGPSVAEIVRQRPSSAIVLDVALQAAAGLRHIHALRVDDRPAGLVHRDVKPSNLLADRSGLVKVADLGMAAAAGASASIGGSPPYLAPEQARGQQDARADIWSLGVVLYELATGRRPFGGDVGAIARARQVEQRLAEPEFLRPVDEHLPGLAEVVRGCLRHEPSARFASVVDLAEALSALSASARGETLLELLARTHPELDVRDPGGRPRTRTSTPTVVVPVGNLPDPRDRFHGRTDEVERLGELVLQSRLVSVVGFGGLGKTRLALEAGRALADAFDGGVWVAELAECRSEVDLCAAIGRALGATAERSDPWGALTDALRALGRALVVLDNLEQVAGPAAAVIAQWLDDVPHAVFLCTSRVPTGARGERLLALGPLDPASAVSLFVDRAVTPPDDLGAVREIVDALEHHPLAIELAAARTRVLPLAAIVQRLGDHLRLLSGGGASRPERHRSLRACVEWSWNLCSAEIRAAAAQLAVFEGGFGLEAAEEVLHLTGDAPWAIDVLTALVDSSLVRVDPATGRFSMLQAVHDFVAAQLTPDDRARAELRHAVHYARVTEGVPPAGLVADLENIDAASRRAAARGEAELAYATAVAAYGVYDRRGPLARARELLEPLLALPGLAPRSRAVALRLAGRTRAHLGDREGGIAQLEEAVTAAGALADPRVEAQARSALGSVCMLAGELDRAELELRRALALGEGAPGSQGQMFGNLASTLQARGRTAEARESYERAIALLQRHGPRRSLVSAQANLGALTMEHGDPAHAERILLSALDGCIAEGDLRLEGTIRGNLGQVRIALGRLAEGREQLEAAIRLDRRVGNRRSEAFVLANLGNAWRLEGRLVEAADSHAAALALAHQLGLRKLEGGLLRELGRDQQRAGRPADALDPVRRSEELLRAIGARYELARTLCLRAELEGVGADEARAIAQQLGVPATSELGTDLARLG